ncbi:MAG: prepilin-type N-terminal cleavage/methylation domain-containing protein [Candidatus Margulisbacteria bacterium]|nr:prepilin-type N-terminal cleavage/methylation domain-containing protein [Candidatus Margulisiibacteriota bacterium]
MKNQKGFTMVELLIVVAIVGILAAIALPRFTSSTKDAKIKADMATIANINLQWEVQNIEDGKYKSLNALLVNKNYFPAGKPVCPFGKSFRDRNRDNRVDVHSH